MLEILVRPPPKPFASERLEQKTSWICPDHLSTPKLLDSHPRGFPTIHLSKSTLISTPIFAKSSAALFLQTSLATLVTVVVMTTSSPSCWLVSRQRGRGILAILSTVSTACSEDFLSVTTSTS